MKIPCISSSIVALFFSFTLTAKQEFNPQSFSKGLQENNGQLISAGGQSLDHILFYTEAAEANVYVTEHGFTFLFRERIEDNKKDKTTAYNWCRTDVVLKGATISKAQVSEKKQAGVHFYQYYRAHCPQGIRAKAYKEITVKDIYPNIDWVLRSDEDGFKYDFVVHPGGDPNKIAIEYIGAGKIKTANNKTQLLLKTPYGILQEGDLVTYEQRTTDNGQQITSSYKLSNNTVRFQLGDYDKSKTLIIDPPMQLVWGTYYGGYHADGPEDIHVDAQGNAMITGYSIYDDPTIEMPLLNPGAGAFFQGTHQNTQYTEAIIVKFNNNGVLLWATYFGGSTPDNGDGITTDANGNIFVVGSSSSKDMPTFDPGGTTYYQGNNASASIQDDAFILKFSPGGVMLWGTYFGGSLSENAFSVATNTAGEVYVVGQVQADMPTLQLAGAFFQGTNLRGGYTPFLLKFDNNGTLLWSTYMGGSDQNNDLSDVTVDAAGKVYLCGHGRATDYPLQNPGGGAYFSGAPQGGNDGVIMVLTAAGQIEWSTYYGGTQQEAFNNIEVDNSGNIYIAAATRSTDAPLMNPGGGAYYQPNHTGFNRDGLILKFGPNYDRQWVTYIGGTSDDVIADITTDANGHVFITGEARYSGFPTMDPGCGAYFDDTEGLTAANGYKAVFVTEFDPQGVMQWSTFYGVDRQDWGEGIDVGPNGCVFVTGELQSTGSFTVDPGGGAYYQPVSNDDDQFDDEGLMLKFCPFTAATATVASTDILCHGDATGTATLTMSGNTTGYSYQWQPGGQTGLTASGLTAGTYTVTITDPSNCTSTKTVTIDEPDEIVLTTSGTITICNNDTATLSASSTGGVPGYSYSWSPNSLTDSVISVAPSTTTDYIVEVTDQNNCKKTDTVHVKVGPPALVSAGPDVTVCDGDSTQLNATGGTAYSWSPTTGLSDPNIADPIATPTSTTTYIVTVTSGTCPPVSDTVVVTVASGVTATVNAASVSICNGDSIQLVAAGGTTYNWVPSVGLDDPNIANPYAFPTSTTTYSVIVTSGQCGVDTAIVEVEVVPSITASVGPDTTICAGAQVTLTASGGSDYSWSPSDVLSASTGASVIATPTTNTTFSVTVTSGSCAPATATATIYVAPAPTISAGADVIIQMGDSVMLNGTGGGIYNWTPAADLSDPNVANPIASPTVTTTYTLTVLDTSGCMTTDVITVTILDACEEEELIYVPSAFSPNGDGMNDVFRVRVKEDCVEIIKFVVFDRWGEKVFEASDEEQAWDGTFRNAYLNSAVFDYYLEALLYDGEKVVQQGNISLIR